MWLTARFPTMVRPPLAESAAGFAPISRLPFSSTYKGESENAVALDRTGSTPFVGFILKQAIADVLSSRSTGLLIGDCATTPSQRTHNKKSRNASFFMVDPLKSSSSLAVRIGKILIT